MTRKKRPTTPDIGGDYLTGFAGEEPVGPPLVWIEQPADWPRKVPYNGVLPDREKYPEPKADPAFAHLLRPSTSKTGKGELVFPPGRAPFFWHPAYAPEGRFKEQGKSAKQLGKPATDPTEGGDPEERADSFRALSRVYSNLPEATLQKIITKLAAQAAGGDAQAQALFVRLESIQASKPIDVGGRALIKPEAVATAERAIVALVAKVGAVYPSGACPWCGGHAAEE